MTKHKYVGLSGEIDCGAISVPPYLAGKRKRSGWALRVDRSINLYLHLIKHRLLPRELWYYVKWAFRANKLLDRQKKMDETGGFYFSAGWEGSENAEYGEWDIFKEVM